MIGLAILGLFAAVTLAAGLSYPPLLVNAAALAAFIAFAWRETRGQANGAKP